MHLVACYYYVLEKRILAKKPLKSGSRRLPNLAKRVKYSFSLVIPIHLSPVNALLCTHARSSSNEQNVVSGYPCLKITLHDDTSALAPRGFPARPSPALDAVYGSVDDSQLIAVIIVLLVALWARLGRRKVDHVAFACVPVHKTCAVREILAFCAWFFECCLLCLQSQYFQVRVNVEARCSHNMSWTCMERNRWFRKRLPIDGGTVLTPRS